MRWSVYMLCVWTWAHSVAWLTPWADLWCVAHACVAWCRMGLQRAAARTWQRGSGTKRWKLRVKLLSRLPSWQQMQHHHHRSVAAVAALTRWTKPTPEQLDSVLHCLHMHSLHSSWVCGPLQLTSLSLPLLSVRVTGFAHVCTSIHKSLLLLDSCPTYCDRCSALRGELSIDSQTSCLYTPTLL